MKTSNKSVSTFEREMTDSSFKKQFDVEYQEFSLSEIIQQLMEEGHLSVHELAKAADISPSVIQDIRSGNRSNITLQILCKLIKALGSQIAIQIGDQYVPLGD